MERQRGLDRSAGGQQERQVAVLGHFEVAVHGEGEGFDEVDFAFEGERLRFVGLYMIEFEVEKVFAFGECGQEETGVGPELVGHIGVAEEFRVVVDFGEK